MLVTFTDKNYILVAIHAPNPNFDANASYDEIAIRLKKILNREIQKAINGATENTNFKFNPSKLFIMGDFNDPSGSLSSIELELNGKQFVYETVNPPKSCCYNFNSSCYLV